MCCVVFHGEATGEPWKKQSTYDGRIMHLSIFFPEGGGGLRDTQGKLDHFEKLVSNSPLMAKPWCLKSLCILKTLVKRPVPLCNALTDYFQP